MFGGKVRIWMEDYFHQSVTIFNNSQAIEFLSKYLKFEIDINCSIITYEFVICNYHKKKKKIEITSR